MLSAGTLCRSQLGSTRLKAGTAQKIALNTFSSAVMVRLNKVYGNLMVDLRATNAKLRQRSIQFLSTPGTYYDALPGRMKELKVPAVREPLQTLRELGIQVDGNEEGYLLQIFMKDASLYFEDPAAGPFFLELIQREGARSFGEGNFRALFEAIEREQAGHAWPAQ